MKKLLVGLLVLGSFSSFAGTANTYCGYYDSAQSEDFNISLEWARQRLNYQLQKVSNIIQLSNQEIKVVNKPGRKEDRRHGIPATRDWREVAICVTVLSE